MQRYTNTLYLNSFPNDPNLQKFQPFQKVIDVRTKRLQRRVWYFSPHNGLLADGQATGQSFKISGHDHQTFDGFLQVM